jgi:hypothetical protein
MPSGSPPELGLVAAALRPRHPTERTHPAPPACSRPGDLWGRDHADSPDARPLAGKWRPAIVVLAKLKSHSDVVLVLAIKVVVGHRHRGSMPHRNETRSTRPCHSLATTCDSTSLPRSRKTPGDRYRIFTITCPILSNSTGDGKGSPELAQERHHLAAGLPVSGAWGDLKAKALAALHRLQRLPHLVRGFFRDPNLRYPIA